MPRTTRHTVVRRIFLLPPPGSPRDFVPRGLQGVSRKISAFRIVCAVGLAGKSPHFVLYALQGQQENLPLSYCTCAVQGQHENLSISYCMCCRVSMKISPFRILCAVGLAGKSPHFVLYVLQSQQKKSLFRTVCAVQGYQEVLSISYCTVCAVCLA